MVLVTLLFESCVRLWDIEIVLPDFTTGKPSASIINHSSIVNECQIV